MTWTDAALVGALWDEAARRGRAPNLDDWPGKAGGLPGKTAYYRRFGSWSNALVAAGLEAAPVGSLPPDEDFMAEVERRCGEGESLASIGREAGITGQALGRRLARYRERRALGR